MNRYLAYAAAGLLIAPGQAFALIVIQSDTTTNTYIGESVEIIEGTNPSPPTTVDLVSPGGLNEVDLYDSSVLNIYDGTTVDEMAVRDASVVNVYGGAVTDVTHVVGNSTLNLYGGQMSAVRAGGSSQWMISGGEVPFADVADAATGKVYGGTIQDLFAGPGLDTQESRITVYGSGFNYDYGEIPVLTGILTGILADGSALNAGLGIDDNAQIVLAPVPEPASVVLLVMPAVILLIFRRWRR